MANNVTFYKTDVTDGWHLNKRKKTPTKTSEKNQN